MAAASFRLLLVGIIALAWGGPVAAAAGPTAQQVAYGPAAQQTADLYAGPDGAPVLVWISGGGWVLDTVGGMRPFGQSLSDRGVTVVSLRRASGAVLQPSDSIALAAGDTLVLSGSPETLARAEAALLAPA